MKSFQFSIKVYVKETRITPFILPKEGMYKCHWNEAGICHFENIENGYTELQKRLENYFHLDQVTEENVLEYYDRLAETLMAIKSQNDFLTALMHSSQTYSPFSLVLKVNAVRMEEHWYNGDIAFNKVWKMSKPKFACIRSWLMSLEREGKAYKHISETCSYSEKAFLFSQLNKIQEDLTNQKTPFSTNQNEATSNLHQSNSPKKTLTSIKPDQQVEFELLESDNENQKMLHEKMMMDPVISLILFNEYIPLHQPKNQKQMKIKEGEEDEEKLSMEMGGLFLGKLEEEPEEKIEIIKEESVDESSLFIRSEPDNSGGLFIRSEDSSATDDWVIA